MHCFSLTHQYLHPLWTENIALIILWKHRSSPRRPYRKRKSRTDHTHTHTNSIVLLSVAEMIMFRFQSTNYFYLWQSCLQLRASHVITSHHSQKQTSGPTDCLVTFANWTKMWVSLQSSLSLSHTCSTENISFFYPKQEMLRQTENIALLHAAQDRAC